ncbi:MAG: acyl-CoA thioesterase-1 [Flavobacteriaceae bacterium]|jgi:acyl-CoA thioesterase-1|uniref:arylesterase n=1 Tax=Candidatus Marifrigoribacter sp. Uisw_064 TaxID=3230970 RepID=UPI003AEA1AEB
MYKAKNIQTFLNLPTRIESKLLKFCYFMIPLFFLSCGNSNKANDTVEKVTQEATDNTIVATSSKKTILCFGDSITAGYGLDDTNDAFPSLLQTKVDSLGLDYVVVNSGLSGETSAGGKSRLQWVLSEPVDIFLLELGANDGLRGVPLTETRANLQAIIDMVHDKNPSTTIILAGMELPPNMGQDYTSEFRSIFFDLAKENDLKFIPFILENVGGIAELNQSDGIHPTVEGHKIVANTVWEVLETVVYP